MTLQPNVNVIANPTEPTSPRRFVDWFLDFTYRNRRWLIASVIGIYLLGFNGQWRVEPDAALYLTLGRNLAEGRGYTYLWKPHHLAYPGMPWLIAATFKIFGTRHLWPAHVLMLLMAFATLVLVYQLFLLHGGPRVAVMMTLGVAITKTFYRYAFEMRSDMPFLLGVMAFLVGYEYSFAGINRSKTKGSVLMFAGLILAAIMRPTIWVLLLGILASFAYTAVRGRMRWRAILLFLGVVVALGLTFRAFDPRRSTSAADDYEAVAIRSVTTGLGDTLRNAVHNNLHDLLYLALPDSLMQIRAGPVNVIFAFVFITIGIGLVREHVLWGVLIGLFVLMNFVVLPLDRYFLPVIPLMAYAWWRLLVDLNKGLPARWGNVVAAMLLTLGLCSNFDKVGGIIVEQRWIPFLSKYGGGTYQPLMQLAKEINRDVGENDLVLIRHADGRIMDYLSHRNVVDFRHFGDVNLAAHKVFVVEPTDPETDKLLDDNHLNLAETVATVPPKSPGKTWTLRLAVPASAQ